MCDVADSRRASDPRRAARPLKFDPRGAERKAATGLESRRLQAGMPVHPRTAIAPGGTNKKAVRTVNREKAVPRELSETLN